MSCEEFHLNDVCILSQMCWNDDCRCLVRKEKDRKLFPSSRVSERRLDSYRNVFYSPRNIFCV